MADFKKIEYYNLKAEEAKLPTLVGRTEEIDRLTRVVSRRINNNAIIVGQPGSGKTTLLRGWIKQLCAKEQFSHLQFIQFEAGHLQDIAESEAIVRYQEALSTVPPSVICIDGFGSAVSGASSPMQRVVRLYGPLLKNPELRLILTMTPSEFSWFEREHPNFLQSFEIIALKGQTTVEYIAMLQNALPRLNEGRAVEVPPGVLQELVGAVERFPVLGQLPRAAITLLDECLGAAVSLNAARLSEEIVQKVIASKTNIPVTQLKHNEIAALRSLEKELNQRVVGQQEAIKKITGALQRAALGMRNPHKPRGSFLMLGPSGVGKTETAKMVAEKMFGHSESFIRFDMSEFAQEHTAQRLLGSPAGYVGHEEGGALTNALKTKPHSLILLDEIEKAHPKVFDIFLQVLDDGRVTSGQNETVDARHAVIMMTSNIAVPEILAGIQNGERVHSDEFVQEKVLPALSRVFRLEFINRFDHILVFNPLTLPVLLEIARLEIKKIEKRLAKHRVEFQIDPAVLEARIKQLADPRFGARPVKRFIEETCESLLVRSLLKEQSL